jgi:DNA-binding beta-propeller fold protein YncE
LTWEQTYDGQCCDRMAISPDGKTLYVPAYRGTTASGGRHWYVVDAATGNLIKKLPTPGNDGPHNTIWSLDGSRVYLSFERSHNVLVSDSKTHTVVQNIGPFSNNVRPFTITGSNTYMFANVDDLLGFEVADLKTGKVIHRVEVEGFGWSPQRIFAHVCPSHGIALSPDEKELWVADGANGYIHIFDATVMPPKQVRSIKTRDFPGWITFGIDGKLVYPSSGDVIEAASKRSVGGLKDELGREVQSEKLVEVLFINGKAARAVDQFGVGFVREASRAK